MHAYGFKQQGVGHHLKGVAGVLEAKYIIMKMISFNDSSIQAYRLGKALLTYTNCVVGALRMGGPMYVYKRLSAKNRSSIQIILHILLLLYNSHKECSVLYLMHAHTCAKIIYIRVCNFKDPGTRGLPAGVHLV